MKKENKRKECTCKEWRILVPQIDSIFIMAWNHGYQYKGKNYKYCPWCSKELK